MAADHASWGPRLRRAFDEVHFGPSRTLNLREGLPTGDEAARRCEVWLRERQMARAGEVLVITGRGAQSAGGVPVVREAIVKLFTALRRRGVITAVQEHSAGSFVVRLAPVTALFEAGRRKRDPQMPKVDDPRALEGLSKETRALLRTLAVRSLEVLGVAVAPGYVTDEMVRQFSALAPGLPEGPAAEREQRLRGAIQRALDELDEQDI